MTNETWRERFDKKWDTSYGKVIYGEKDAGFMTCDLGEQFTVDKELVKDFIQSEIDKALDSQKREIFGEIKAKLREGADIDGNFIQRDNFFYNLGLKEIMNNLK